MKSRLEAAGLSLLVLYFAYHAFAGVKGLGSDLNRLQVDIRRLTPGSVDPDFVEAMARDKLAFVYPNEIVLVSSEPSSAN